jgi:hypothetical protein
MCLVSNEKIISAFFQLSWASPGFQVYTIPVLFAAHITRMEMTPILIRPRMAND